MSDISINRPLWSWPLESSYKRCTSGPTSIQHVFIWPKATLASWSVLVALSIVAIGTLALTFD